MAKITISNLNPGTPPPLTGAEIVPLVRNGITVNATLAELPVSDLAAPKSNPTFTGSVVVPTPTASNQATTKGYVDSALASVGVKTQATITGNYTILGTDENIFVNTASAITVSIPNALPLGKAFNIIRLIAGGAITVDTVGAETINGSATFSFVASGQYTAVEFKKATATDYIWGRQGGDWYGNSEAVVNTNGVTGKTTKGQWTPILNNTVATYYDVLLDRPLLRDEVPKIVVRSKVDGNTVPVEIAGVPSLNISNFVSQYIDVGNSSNSRPAPIRIAKITAGQIRVLLARNPVGVDESILQGRTWAQVVSASDGYDAWALVIAQI